MQFISNKSLTENHLTAINDGLSNFNEAYFAVAFLKMSGYSSLLPQLSNFIENGGEIKIVVGQYFALTEPKALYALFNLFQKYPTSKLFLAKAEIVTSVFHPKLYLYKSSDNCRVISGSANLTKGGLISNKETSLSIDCDERQSIWLDAKGYFETLVSSEHAEEASLLVIQQYETFYEQQKQANKQIKPIPIKTKAQLAFNYDNLIKHFKKFNNPERQQNFKDKLNNYKKARAILDQIADNPKLTKKQFEPLLDNLVGSKDIDSLWHSGSLYRLRKFVYPYYIEFHQLVRYIRDHQNDPAGAVFEKAKEMVKPIEGAAVNYVAELMMTYNSSDFANLNKNPITVLKEEGGVNLKAHSSSFTAIDYEKYTLLVKEISLRLGLKNMLEADSFFNEIYWELD
ncbi:phospholipase D-like domain-containing protein [Pedobacter nototheniae]|uniref:phospholipase D-like domain-containing protein n=1 Tax=Pedobacter nototheniae TaxID=2488994 RepID=UPI00292D3BA3|nr:phospholipase D-like domain-containing protein [Pedobacter nototheniae]